MAFAKARQCAKRHAPQPSIPPIAVSTTPAAPLQTAVPPYFFAHRCLTNKNNEKEDVEANVGIHQGRSTRQKAHRPARHPAHRRFHNTGSPIANRTTTPFLCTQMVNKQEQRKRRRRSERWHSPRLDNVPKGALPSPASRPLWFSVLYYSIHYLLNVSNTHLVAQRRPKRGTPCHCVAVSLWCARRSRSSLYPCKRIGHCNPKRTFVGTSRGCRFRPSQFDGWLIRSTLEADLRFRLDLLTRFDVDEATSFIIGWCCAFCGG